MRFLFAEGFSKYLLSGFFKYFKENLKFFWVAWRNFFSCLSFLTIFLWVNNSKIKIGYFLIVTDQTLNMHYFHKEFLVFVGISFSMSFLSIKVFFFSTLLFFSLFSFLSFSLFFFSYCFFFFSLFLYFSFFFSLSLSFSLALSFSLSIYLPIYLSLYYFFLGGGIIPYPKSILYFSPSVPLPSSLPSSDKV